MLHILVATQFHAVSASLLHQIARKLMQTRVQLYRIWMLHDYVACFLRTSALIAQGLRDPSVPYARKERKIVRISSLKGFYLQKMQSLVKLEAQHLECVKVSRHEPTKNIGSKEISIFEKLYQVIFYDIL